MDRRRNGVVHFSWCAGVGGSNPRQPSPFSLQHSRPQSRSTHAFSWAYMEDSLVAARELGYRSRRHRRSAADAACLLQLVVSATRGSVRGSGCSRSGLILALSSKGLWGFLVDNPLSGRGVIPLEGCRLCRGEGLAGICLSFFFFLVLLKGVHAWKRHLERVLTVLTIWFIFYLSVRPYTAVRTLLSHTASPARGVECPHISKIIAVDRPR